jgi:anti-anti-sigma factor
MEIRQSEKDTTLILQLSGDISNVEAIRLSKHIESYRNTGYTQILFDLSTVNFIDSNAIGGFLFMNSIMKRAGIELVLADPGEHILELFRDCNIDKIITISNQLQTPAEQNVPVVPCDTKPATTSTCSGT